MKKSPPPTHQDLRRFALACYARPGVESACLELQAAGADVCLLLAGAWLQRRGIACTAARLAELRQVSEDWQAEVVQPLRNLRQTWREEAQKDEALRTLREQVKQLELEAEFTQLDRLQQAARQWPAERESGDWLGALCASLPGDTRAPLEHLRRAAMALETDRDG